MSSTKMMSAVFSFLVVASSSSSSGRCSAVVVGGPPAPSSSISDVRGGGDGGDVDEWRYATVAVLRPRSENDSATSSSSSLPDDDDDDDETSSLLRDLLRRDGDALCAVWSRDDEDDVVAVAVGVADVASSATAECAGCLCDRVVVDLSSSSSSSDGALATARALSRGARRRAADDDEPMVVTWIDADPATESALRRATRDGSVERHAFVPRADVARRDVVAESGPRRRRHPVPPEAFPALVRAASSALAGPSFRFDRPRRTTVGGAPTTTTTRSNVDEETISDHDETEDPRHHVADALERVLGEVSREANLRLRTLKNKQEEALLSDGAPPILEFGRDAEALLRDVGRRFNALLESVVAHKDVVARVKDARDEALRRLAHGPTSSSSSSSVASLLSFEGDLGDLFRDQLSALREFHGRAYERSLDDGAEDGATAAARATEAFRAAAAAATPASCRPEAFLEHVAYDHVDELRGLLSDLTDATERWEEAERDWADATNDDESDDDDNGVETTRRRPPATWYQKLGARVLVVAVNYAQGWLAWQGLKRAAAERDRNTPKFPLF